MEIRTTRKKHRRSVVDGKFHGKQSGYLILIAIALICVGIVFYIATRMRYPYLFTNPSEWIADWLKNPICEVPCWEEITPGKTSRNEAESLLSNNPEFGSVEERDVIPYGLMLFVDVRGDKYEPTNVSIKFDNKNIVQEIDLVTFGGNLYLHDIVLTYGFPKQVFFVYWDYGYTMFYLLYPELGVVVELDGYSKHRNNASVNIQSFSKINNIYLSAAELTSVFDSSGIAKPSGVYEWKGYATYP